MKAYLGIDVGSVTTKLVAVDGDGRLVADVYLKTDGRPVIALQAGLRELKAALPAATVISGVAATGSGRYLAGVLVGADIVKNEITCHAAGALHHLPGVRTVIEIGGQDSKLILIRDGLIADFSLNTVCAAGTGSFLDHQAQRLNLNIEEFSRKAVEGRRPVRISGKCTVFAESDMINKQQMGYGIEDIVYGLCRALAGSYLNDTTPGKEVLPPVIFQGGVARNIGMIRALEEALGMGLYIPSRPELTGALGAALIAREEVEGGGQNSSFKGFGVSEQVYQPSSFECKSCPNNCEITQLTQENRVVVRWGGRCDIWGGTLEEVRKNNDNRS